MVIPYQHAPVMAEEVVKYLNPSAGKVIIDATLGGGGHSEKLKIKSPKLKIIGIDQDLDALEAAKERLKTSDNIRFIHDNFSNIKNHVKEKVDGILFDLGVSSYQIEEPSRGFSFQKDGPLDMRMDRSQKFTASDIVNTWPAGEIEKIIREYGEERFAKRISNAICVMRRACRQAGNAKKINTAFELKEIIEKAIPTWKKRESVARVFQSLRIAVNSELKNLKKGLTDAIDLLNPTGRIVVISYHSLEDRIVKHIFREKTGNGILKVLTKKPVRPGVEEIRENPRAGSAKLRAGEKM